METLELPNEILLAEVSDILNEGSSVILRTKGNSMLPFIHGDHDSVELHKPDSLNVNHIVLAHLGGGRYVLHRLIGIDSDRITLMGDGNIYGTEHCTISDIKGVTRYIIRENGDKIDCYSPSMERKVRIWRRLLPIRRYLLGIYRRII